jgi:hypothetical protein
LQEVTDIGAAALDEELGEPFALLAVGLAAEVRGEVQELFVQQREQGAKGFVLAAVGRGRRALLIRTAEPVDDSIGKKRLCLACRNVSRPTG